MQGASANIGWLHKGILPMICTWTRQTMAMEYLLLRIRLSTEIVKLRNSNKCTSPFWVQLPTSQITHRIINKMKWKSKTLYVLLKTGTQGLSSNRNHITAVTNQPSKQTTPAWLFSFPNHQVSIKKKVVSNRIHLPQPQVWWVIQLDFRKQT